MLEDRQVAHQSLHARFGLFQILFQESNGFVVGDPITDGKAVFRCDKVANAHGGIACNVAIYHEAHAFLFGKRFLHGFAHFQTSGMNTLERRIEIISIVERDRITRFEHLVVDRTGAETHDGSRHRQRRLALAHPAAQALAALLAVLAAHALDEFAHHLAAHPVHGRHQFVTGRALAGRRSGRVGRSVARTAVRSAGSRYIFGFDWGVVRCRTQHE